MDFPPTVGYRSTLAWIGEDPRAGRPPVRCQNEKTVKRHDFKDGEVIFRKGDPSDAAYLITHGQIEIVQERPDEETESVAVLRRGEYFGEMGAIDEKRRSASAIAKGPVACMSVSQEEFMDMLLNRPQESIDLLKVLFERLRKANEKLARIEGHHGD